MCTVLVLVCYSNVNITEAQLILMLTMCWNYSAFMQIQNKRNEVLYDADVSRCLTKRQPGAKLLSKNLPDKDCTACSQQSFQRLHYSNRTK